MENDKDDLVELASNRIISAKDHTSVQISVSNVGESGHLIPGDNKLYALCEFVRGMGKADDALNRLVKLDEYVKSIWSDTR